MRFIVHDENDVSWMRDPEGCEAGETIKRIKDAGKWDALLSLHQDEDGNVDCDALYDYLRHESGNALLDVGLHDSEGKATAMDVVNAWAREQELIQSGLKVSYCADGKTPSGLELFSYDNGKCTDLEFESVDVGGTVDTVSLDADDVLYLVGGSMAHGNANSGAWTGTDVESDVFDMWFDRDR